MSSASASTAGTGKSAFEELLVCVVLHGIFMIFALVSFQSGGGRSSLV